MTGLDRDALIAAIHRDTVVSSHLVGSIADVVLAHIAAHDEGRKDAACDRDHNDDWVEVDDWPELPEGARIRSEWLVDVESVRRFVHRDDLPDPDPDAARIERMAKAIFASEYPYDEWGHSGEALQGACRKNARAALAAYREEDR